MFSFHLKPNICNVDDFLEESSISEYLKTDDHVVTLTSWRPLSNGGQDFKSHKMVRIDDDHVEFRISFQSVMAYLSILVVGVVVMIISIFGKMMGMSGSGNPIVMFLIGLLFAGLGFYLFRKAKQIIAINRVYPAIYKGKVDPANVINPQTIEYFHYLDKLHALQLLQKYVKSDSDGKDNSYFSYELNLVLHDGARIKVLDHGNINAMTKQASDLSDFLNVPLWSVIWPEQQSLMSKMF
jgi:hypothetical protein